MYALGRRRTAVLVLTMPSDAGQKRGGKDESRKIIKQKKGRGGGRRWEGGGAGEKDSAVAGRRGRADGGPGGDVGARRNRSDVEDWPLCARALLRCLAVVEEERKMGGGGRGTTEALEEDGPRAAYLNCPSLPHAPLLMSHTLTPCLFHSPPPGPSRIFLVFSHAHAVIILLFSLFSLVHARMRPAHICCLANTPTY